MHRNVDVRIVIPSCVIRDNERTMSLLTSIKTSLKKFLLTLNHIIQSILWLGKKRFVTEGIPFTVAIISIFIWYSYFFLVFRTSIP